MAAALFPTAGATPHGWNPKQSLQPSPTPGPTATPGG
jgi:hypothetical protein